MTAPATPQIHPLQMSQEDYDAWLTASRMKIGGSDVGALLGVNKYMTPRDLYRRKLGIGPQFKGNHHTRRGNRMEEVAAEELAEKTGWTLRHGGFANHPTISFIGGRPDRIATLPDGSERIIEIKVPNPDFSDGVLVAGVDPSYQAQANYYMGLTGLAMATFCYFDMRNWTPILIDMPFDAELYDLQISVAETFWNEHIRTRREPPGAPERPAPALPRLGAEFHPAHDIEATNALSALLAAKRELTIAEEAEKTARKRVTDLMESRRQYGLLIGNSKISWFEQTRRSLDEERFATAHPDIDLDQFKKTTVFRTLRVKE